MDNKRSKVIGGSGIQPEYKRYQTREEMLKNPFRRHVHGLTVIGFPLLMLLIIVHDSDLSMRVFVGWCIALTVLCLATSFFLEKTYASYVFSFRHRSLAAGRFLAGLVITAGCLVLLSYGIYAIDKEKIFIYHAALFLFTLVITIYSIVNEKNKYKKYFHKCYKLINGKLFFDCIQFNQNIKEFSKNYYLLLLALLGFLTFSAGISHALRYSKGFAGISMTLAALMFYSICLPMVVTAWYQRYIVQPRVEKVFNQPMLSDYWGFFEVNPQIAETVFGPAPVERPIRYEEVFPEDTDSP